METFLPICLFCVWHVVLLGVGVWIGHSRPWRWRIVRDDIYPESAQAHPNTHPYYDYEEESFPSLRRKP